MTDIIGESVRRSFIVFWATHWPRAIVLEKRKKPITISFAPKNQYSLLTANLLVWAKVQTQASLSVLIR